MNTVLRIRVSDHPFHLFLLSALFPWAWFSASITQAAPSFAGNANLLKKVYFPRFVLPFTAVLYNMVHFILSLPILIVLLLAAKMHPGPAWIIGLPILIAVQAMVLIGIVLAVATLTVFLRDLEHLLEVFLNLWFYITPILYSLDVVPGKARYALKLNPMTSLIEAWRNLFLENSLPSIDIWPSLIFAAVAIVAGVALFRWLEGHFENAL